jgi:hypothetical protein
MTGRVEMLLKLYATARTGRHQTAQKSKWVRPIWTQSRSSCKYRAHRMIERGVVLNEWLKMPAEPGKKDELNVARSVDVFPLLQNVMGSMRWRQTLRCVESVHEFGRMLWRQPMKARVQE